MKIHKLALVAIGLSAAIAVKQPVFADDAPATATETAPATAPAPAAPAAHGLKGLIEALALTPDQTAQIKPIWKDAETQMKAVRADTTLAPADRKEKRRAIETDRNQKINAILTPDQQKKWEEMKEQRRAAKQ